MSSIKFGMMLPVGTKGELDSDCGDAAAHWQHVRSIAQRAEELGFDSIHVPDHLHNTPVAANRSLFECWTTLAALAEATRTVRLGQSVTNAAFRNPALLAKITSTIDVISGGRLDWVVGAGWFEPEHRSYGYGFGTPPERLALLEETIQIVKKMWTLESSDFTGEFCSISQAQCDPKPIQRPHPPVWVGGHGPRLMHIAARHADRVMSGGSCEEFEQKMAALERGCAKENRDPGSIGRVWFGECLIAETETEVRAHYDARKAATAASRTGEGSDEAWRKLFDADFNRWADKFLCGTVEQIKDKMTALRSMGVEYVVVTFADLPAAHTMEKFAATIMPLFNDGPAALQAAR
jgi:alkanesulfonate monooxygenase SsuD/methylene tetrahydromethanopterin reductase-like flavin-dependent oxidoreductase (luciferase family)